MARTSMSPDVGQAREITQRNYWFYALIIAAMMQADDHNYKKLAEAFPRQAAELTAYRGY